MRRTSRKASTSATSRTPRSLRTIAEAIQTYLLYHESSNSQPKTLEWHTHCLGAFRTYCDAQEITDLAALTTEDIQRWIVELQKTPGQNGKRSSRTVSWYVRSVRAFYRWCCRRGFAETDITDWLDLPKVERPLIRILEPEEFIRLLAACDTDSNNRSTGPHHVSRNE